MSGRTQTGPSTVFSGSGPGSIKTTLFHYDSNSTPTPDDTFRKDLEFAEGRGSVLALFATASTSVHGRLKCGSIKIDPTH
jgi:hypothetical protein